MTFDDWFDHKTSLPGKHSNIARLVWDAAFNEGKKDAAKEIIEMSTELESQYVRQPWKARVLLYHKIKETFGLEEA